MIRRADMQIWPWWRNAPNAVGVDRVLEVGVAEHDQRVVAAELEHDALELPAGRLGELAAGAGRAGEVEPPHVRVLDQLVADRGGLARRVRDDVEHARRAAPASAKISPQIRPPTIGDHSDGLSTTVLPSTSGAAIERAERISAAFHGRDRADDADRAAAGPSRTRRGCRTGSPRRAARTRAPRPGGTARARSASGTCRSRTSHPVSRASSDDDLVLAALEDVGGLEEDPLPHGRRRLRPGGNAAAAASTARARVGARCRRGLGHDVAGERIAILERATALGAGPFARR